MTKRRTPSNELRSTATVNRAESTSFKPLPASAVFEIGILREQLKRGREPGETVEQFAERYIVKLWEILERDATFSQKRRGRPPHTLLTRPIRTRRAKGRPRKYDGLLETVEDRIAAAGRDGRRLSYPAALREIMVEAMKKMEPARHKRLVGLISHYQDEVQSKPGADSRAQSPVDSTRVSELSNGQSDPLQR